jgi:cytochrome b
LPNLRAHNEEFFMPTAPSIKTVQAWDLPTRLFHWSLVIALVSAWASFTYANKLGDHNLVWHKWNGYFILVLLVWRVIWGFVGSETSRLKSFVTWPWRAAGYALDLVRGRDRHFLGHNPLGTYMILALFGVVGAQATLGLFSVEHNDLTAGPLYRLVSEATYVKITKWHIWAFYWVILPLIAIHVTANTLYGLVKKDPLIRAMVTGKKPERDYEDGRGIVVAQGTNLKALIVLVVAIVIVLGGIRLLGGRIF